jgi:hypothetical protein
MLHNGETDEVSCNSPCCRVNLPTYQMLQNRRIDRVGREGVFGVYDSKRTVLFERCRVITEFIEQYAEGPDIY